MLLIKPKFFFNQDLYKNISKSSFGTDIPYIKGNMVSLLFALRFSSLSENFHLYVDIIMSLIELQFMIYTWHWSIVYVPPQHVISFNGRHTKHRIFSFKGMHFVWTVNTLTVFNSSLIINLNNWRSLKT